MKKSSRQITGKVVALTGASGFLVSEMSKALSLKGWKVALLDQNLDGVESLARSICERKGEAIAIKTDVSTKDSYHNALEVILKKWDHLDGAVFGAGFNAPTPFLEILYIFLTIASINCS